MHGYAEAVADRLEAETLRALERIYPAALSPLMEKHKPTLDRLDKLEKAGATARARVMLRRSGMLEEIAVALAAAGKEAAALIRQEMSQVKEAAYDEGEAG